MGGAAVVIAIIVLILVMPARAAITAHGNAPVAVLPEAAVMLGIADTAATVVAFVVLIIGAVRFIAAKPVIVL